MFRFDMLKAVRASLHVAYRVISEACWRLNPFLVAFDAIRPCWEVLRRSGRGSWKQPQAEAGRRILIHERLGQTPSFSRAGHFPFFDWCIITASFALWLSRLARLRLVPDYHIF
jgi:hypothetical protein